jgi:hypothetical protein
MAVTALHHLHFMVRDSRERTPAADPGRKQHREGD